MTCEKYIIPRYVIDNKPSINPPHRKKRKKLPIHNNIYLEIREIIKNISFIYSDFAGDNFRFCLLKNMKNNKISYQIVVGVEEYINDRYGFHYIGYDRWYRRSYWDSETCLIINITDNYYYIPGDKETMPKKTRNDIIFLISKIIKNDRYVADIIIDYAYGERYYELYKYSRNKIPKTYSNQLKCLLPKLIEIGYISKTYNKTR